MVFNHNSDFLFVSKRNSHPCLLERLHPFLVRSTGWYRVRNSEGRHEADGVRWMSDVPVRDGNEAVLGTWREDTIRSDMHRRSSQPYYDTFSVSLEVTADNAAEIVRAGRTRWPTENEPFNTPARWGCHFLWERSHITSSATSGTAATASPTCCRYWPSRSTGCWTASVRCGAGPIAPGANRRKFFLDVQALTCHFRFANRTPLCRRILHPKVSAG